MHCAAQRGDRSDLASEEAVIPAQAEALGPVIPAQAEAHGPVIPAQAGIHGRPTE
jgi:hypothetical protein